MSNRKKDLRAAVAQCVDQLVASAPHVEEVVGPRYDAEDLEPGPRTPVWIAGDTIGSQQGPDWSTVQIAVGVTGLTFDAEGFSLSDDSLREQELKKNDELDEILNQIKLLWTPEVQEAVRHLSDFRFQDITRPLQIDTALYREQGIWLSAVILTYLDQRDE